VEFAGFVDSDFDAYQQRKWSSNLFNRERLEVKQKLLALAPALTSALSAAGVQLSAEASVEHPALWNGKRVESQHVYFVRGGDARRALELELVRARGLAAQLRDPSPLRDHVVLAVSIDARQVEVGLRLDADARVDRQNLEQRLLSPWDRLRFVEQVAALGPDHQLAVVAEPRVALPCPELDDRRLTEVLGALGRARPGEYLFLGRVFARDDVRVHQPDFGQLIQDTLVRLSSVYTMAAWARTNDAVAFADTVREEKQVRRQRGLAKNDRVKILSGVFAGQAGLVQEVDAKGQLKVLVGKLAVKMDAADVSKA
jgi:hypothetical protein